LMALKWNRKNDGELEICTWNICPQGSIVVHKLEVPEVVNVSPIATDLLAPHPLFPRS
jgi:hypothetical protein